VVRRAEVVDGMAGHLELQHWHAEEQSRADQGPQDHGGARRDRGHRPSTTKRTAPSVKWPSADSTFHRAW